MENHPLDNNPISPESMKGFYAIFSFITAGLLAKKLISPERIDWRKFAGEWILAGLGAVALWAMGVLNGLTLLQMILVGTAAGLGGVRSLEWAIKIIMHIRKLQ